MLGSSLRPQYFGVPGAPQSRASCSDFGAKRHLLHDLAVNRAHFDVTIQGYSMVHNGGKSLAKRFHLLVETT